MQHTSPLTSGSADVGPFLAIGPISKTGVMLIFHLLEFVFLFQREDLFFPAVFVHHDSDAAQSDTCVCVYVYSICLFV